MGAPRAPALPPTVCKFSSCLSRAINSLHTQPLPPLFFATALVIVVAHVQYYFARSPHRNLTSPLLLFTLLSVASSPPHYIAPAHRCTSILEAHATHDTRFQT
jgi:hypothetical protein